MKNTLFPEVVKQMKLHKENQKQLADVLGLTFQEQVSRRLSGKVDWTFSDVEILCKHYNMDFYELFRKESKNENI